MVRAAHGFLIMFDDDKRIAMEGESFQSVEKPGVVTGMETDGRFVENIEDTPQVRAELCCEAYPLGFAAT